MLRACVACSLIAAEACDPSQGTAACFGNGVCDSKARTCSCEAGWEGQHCTRLKLLPADPAAQGFADSSCPVWGGTVVKHGDQWHLFSGGKYRSDASKSGAHVVRAVSKSGPAGPYAYVEEVLDKVPGGKKRLPNGLGLRADAHLTPEGQLVVFTVTSLDGKFGFVGLVNEQGNPAGPFEPFLSFHYVKNSSAVWDSGFKDASATIKPDGSILVVYRTDYEVDQHEHVGLLHADHWRDPLQKLTTDETGHLFGFSDTNEDPYIWWSQRGVHMLFHTQMEPDGKHNRKYRGAYAFAPGDGKTIASWKISYDYVWPETLSWSNGTSGQIVARRQRPSLIFAPGGPPVLGGVAAPRPTHLITGANFFESDWTHTDANTMLVQEIDYGSTSHSAVLAV